MTRPQYREPTNPSHRGTDSFETSEVSGLIDQLAEKALAESGGNIAGAETLMRGWLSGDDSFAVLARESLLDSAIRREVKVASLARARGFKQPRATRDDPPETAPARGRDACSTTSRSLVAGLVDMAAANLMNFQLLKGKRLADATKVDLIVESNLYLSKAKETRATGVWLRLVAAALKANDDVVGTGLEGGEAALKALRGGGTEGTTRESGGDGVTPKKAASKKGWRANGATVPITSMPARPERKGRRKANHGLSPVQVAPPVSRRKVTARRPTKSRYPIGSEPAAVAEESPPARVGLSPNEHVRKAKRRGHRKRDAHLPAAPPSTSIVVPSIRAYARIYGQLQRAEVRLTLQIKAIERLMRGGHQQFGSHDESASAHALETPDQHSIDDNLIDVRDGEEGGLSMRDAQSKSASLLATFAAQPLIQARAIVTTNRKAQEKQLRALARELPVYSLIERTRGVADLSLALIVGEADDLAIYANPAKLWKRMGLSVENGKAQRKVSGKTKEATEEAIRQGYCPRRRALAHIIGENLIRAGGEYADLYRARKAMEVDKLVGYGVKKKGLQGWAHKRAMRWMEKRFLRELWREWRRCAGIEETAA